jgi:hypothetical protein
LQRTPDLTMILFVFRDIDLDSKNAKTKALGIISPKIAKLNISIFIHQIFNTI